MKPLCVFLFLISLLSACSTRGSKTNPTYEAELEAWIGRSDQQLVDAWGVPSSHWTKSDGTRLMQYTSRTLKRVDGGIGPLNLHPAFVPADCTTTFTSDRSGRLVSWEYDGNAC